MRRFQVLALAFLLMFLAIAPVAYAQPNPWDDLIDAVENLRDASVVPPTVPQSAIILDHRATVDVWTGQVLTHGGWSQWYPAQPFIVSGTSNTVPVQICLNQSGRVTTDAGGHAFLALRLTVDGAQNLQISTVVEAHSAGLYRIPGGGCATFALPPGPHSVMVQYNNYPFPPYYGQLAYLRPMTVPDHEFLNLQAVQLGN